MTRGQLTGRSLIGYQVHRELARIATLIALPIVIVFALPHHVLDWSSVHSMAQTHQADGGERHNSRDGYGADLLAGEYVIGAYSGVAYTHSSDVHIERADGARQTLKSVKWDGLPFRNPIYYGVRVSAWAKGVPVGLMIDFTHAKAIGERDNEVEVEKSGDGQPTSIRAKLGSLFRKLEFSHGHNILLLNGLLRLPMGTERLSPYVGLGAGVSIPHVEIAEQNGGGRTYGYQFAGPAFQALAGVELRLAHTSVFLEYKLSFSPYKPILKDPAGGRLSTDLLTHHLIGGFSLRASRAVPASP